MTSIAEGYKGVVYPNIDEGITVVFLPSKCRDTLNIAIQAAKEILTEIKVLASKHHFADICNLRIGIATERVTSATLEAGGNSTYDVFGIAVGYAKSLALYDKVEKNSILIYKPPLDEGSRQHLKEVHGIKEESVSKTSRRIRSVITGIEFYKI
jgi:class 3 adenylate cyclase